MPDDAGSQIKPRRPFRLSLPRITNLRIRKVQLESPKLTYFRSSLAEQSDAVEFLADTDGDVPARSYGPALYVGDVEVNQSERLEPQKWRFLSYEPESLEPGAPISWGWMREPQRNRQRTEYRYIIEEESQP